MLDEIYKYAKHINANDEVLTWIRTAAKKALEKNKVTISELEHVLDFLNSEAAPRRLQKMSITDAKRKASEWSERNKKKGRNLIDTEDDIETFIKFKSGSKIVRLKSKAAFRREGFMMSHCLGGYSPSSDLDIYSYRDQKNEPHATFEIRKNSNEVIQIKGKGNGPIHPRYIKPVLLFLRKLGLDIRPNDMVNLGYYHVDRVHLKFLEQFDGAKEQLVRVNGEYYAR